MGTRKDRFWSHLIWPLLWPLLLVQAALVLLCLLVGGVLWVATPDPTSWAESAWLLLALLVGTALTVSAFLLQLRHRMHECENQIESRLGRVERLLQESEQLLPRWLGGALRHWSMMGRSWSGWSGCTMAWSSCKGDWNWCPASMVC
ncbi:hypothetical protein EKK97_16960 [Billgrantia tianxiuensis]|uniref:Uncharacterized protein n=1 Tax=Billgrantia tianxiuensis TaxID=2497861 RepID=A0A6I6SUV2_9GAMM|nr:hypothetical protein [Halomonas tianxiuensis]QHC50933.1 hypothetical protein EKK97_16960 [Halomonas tianxiuensis]